MAETEVLLDAFTRVYESLHRTLADITAAELIQEPHPPIGWLAWRLSRIMDSNVARLAGREQLWIGDGWAARFGMAPEPADFGDRPLTPANKCDTFVPHRSCFWRTTMRRMSK